MVSSSIQPSATSPLDIESLADAFANGNPTGASLAIVTEVPSMEVTVDAIAVGSGALVTIVAIATDQPEVTTRTTVVAIDEPRRVH
ncbi:hypothetical protein GUJ93_ZPchr0015g6784 [Zizania palustris]|uniref:Uncharacterized protein n=1 Tax=Zizania palustris TaxID=103762 RepID=A0A8J5THH1_ZIZPA|nr:hypothetical protein GUJ93_ZPchr0015g6784 [Zizania palustris]